MRRRFFLTNVVFLLVVALHVASPQLPADATPLTHTRKDVDSIASNTKEDDLSSNEAADGSARDVLEGPSRASRHAAMLSVHTLLQELFQAYSHRHAETCARLLWKPDAATAAAAGSGRRAQEAAAGTSSRAGAANDPAAAAAAHFQANLRQDDRFIVSRLKLDNGWGNRLPGIVLAAVLALVTNRTLLLTWQLPTHVDPLEQYITSPLAWQYSPWDTHLEQLSTLNLSGHTLKSAWVLEDFMSVGGDAGFSNSSASGSGSSVGSTIGSSNGSWADARVWSMVISDNYMPFLQANPSLRPFFARYFPLGEVFAPLSALLLRPSPRVAALADDFLAHNFVRRRVVGLQMRAGRAAVRLMPSTFWSLARKLVQSRGLAMNEVTFFIAADEPSTYEAAAEALGAANVCWTNNSVGSSTTPGANTGTEESGMLDLYLLSRCDDLFITHSSSFGYTAAAWGYVLPTYVYGHRRDGAVQLHYVYPAVSSEPCCYMLNDVIHLQEKGSARAKHVATLIQGVPGWEHQAQCHFFMINGVVQY